jgi:hypothetical protein
MGERTVAEEQLFYEFSLECHVPADHLPRAIDRLVDLTDPRMKSSPALPRRVNETAYAEPQIDSGMKISPLL